MIMKGGASSCILHLNCKTPAPKSAFPCTSPGACAHKHLRRATLGSFHNSKARGVARAAVQDTVPETHTPRHHGDVLSDGGRTQFILKFLNRSPWGTMLEGTTAGKACQILSQSCLAREYARSRKPKFYFLFFRTLFLIPSVCLFMCFGGVGYRLCGWWDYGIFFSISFIKKI